ncbi:MAG: cobaltochelatase subunit CobN [Victivallis sp.]
MVQNSGGWEVQKGIAETYLNDMGALWAEDHWGEHVEGVFKAALINARIRWWSAAPATAGGPLSLDHVYEFTGGLSIAARHVTGKDHSACFNDLRTPAARKCRRPAKPPWSRRAARC